MSNVKPQLEQYCNSYPSSTGLYFWSHCNGRGKTFFSYLVCASLLSFGKIESRLYFINLLKLLTELKRTYAPNSLDHESQILDEMDRSEMVVIDDVGAETPREWIGMRLYEIINNRYDNEQPIILTSNLDLDQLEQQWNSVGNGKMGSRIVDRLREMTQEVHVGEGRSYRV